MNLNNIVGTVASAGIGMLSNAQTNRYNQELARLQNQMNIDQWNRENVYNSPQAQMARMKEAGLNPNLIYGNINTDTPQLSGKLTAGTPQQRLDPATINTLAQGQLMKAQARNLNADSEGKEIDNETKSEMNRSTIDEIQSRIQCNQATARRIEKESEKIVQETVNLEKEGQLLDVDLEYRAKDYEARIDLLKKQADLTEEQAKAVVIQADLYREQIKTQRTQQELNKANAAAAYADAEVKTIMAQEYYPRYNELLDAQKAYYDSLKGNAAAQKKAQDLLNQRIDQVNRWYKEYSKTKAGRKAILHYLAEDTQDKNSNVRGLNAYFGVQQSSSYSESESHNSGMSFVVPL
ncbi:minor capsid protein [Capybara microvirus Cap3_SP_374]|nr:minor capsid protein [Capybara microvirus Cap3_SP_374]